MSAAGTQHEANLVSNDLRHWAATAPDRIAVRIGAESLSYAELEARANQLARLFESMELVRGDHIAAFLPNTTFMLVIAWAAYRSGLYFTPASTSLSAHDAAYIVTNSQSKLVFGNPGIKLPVVELPALCAGNVRWISHHGDVPGYNPIEPLMSPMDTRPRVEEFPGALMLYTSGTTGSPKGVWRPLPPADYRGTPPFALDLIKLFSYDQHVRYLSTAPLYHAAPLRASLAVTAAGGTVIGMRKFDAREALQTLMDERITHSQWVPTMLQRLLALPEDIRRAFHAPHHAVALHAAAPCPAQVKRAMIAWWGRILVEYYSGSESVGLTMIDSHQWLAHPGSVGRTVKGVPHILDDDWAELPAGRTGRIYFSGITPFQYYGDPEKTSGRTSPQGFQTLGDIGYLDGEGYMYLTDRMDDMIISGGVNIYPQEIETAIQELPEVADVGVVGVPDADFGERPAAFVVAAGITAPNQLEALVRAHCELRLGRIKAPVRYVVLDELPRSPTGKLLRRELRSLVAG